MYGTTERKFWNLIFQSEDEYVIQSEADPARYLYQGTSAVMAYAVGVDDDWEFIKTEDGDYCVKQVGA